MVEPVKQALLLVVGIGALVLIQAWIGTIIAIGVAGEVWRAARGGLAY